MCRYAINSKTLALVPINKSKTIIYEGQDYFIVNDSANSIMDENCKYYGSDIEGRKKGSYTLTGFSYKTPIILSEDSEIIFFPTCSPRLKECAWVNAKNIKKIDKIDQKTIINFFNDEELSFDVSFNILKNQYFKSLSLENALRKRKNN